MNKVAIKKISALALSLALIGIYANDASAVDPTGWRVVGKEIQMKFRAYDGRNIVIGFADCVGPANAKGLVISCYRPNRVPARKVLSEAECREFSSIAHAQKGFFGDMWGIVNAIRDVADSLVDLIRDIDRFAQVVVADVRELGKAIYDLVSSVMGVSGRFNKTFMARSYVVGGRDVVVDHAKNIAVSVAEPRLTLAQKAALAYGSTLSRDKSGRLVVELCFTILN